MFSAPGAPKWGHDGTILRSNRVVIRFLNPKTGGLAGYAKYSFCRNLQKGAVWRENRAVFIVVFEGWTSRTPETRPGNKTLDLFPRRKEWCRFRARPGGGMGFGRDRILREGVGDEGGASPGGALPENFDPRRNILMEQAGA